MERVLVAGLHNVRTHRCVVSTYISMCTMSHWSVVVRCYIPGSDYARRARPSQSTSLIIGSWYLSLCNCVGLRIPLLLRTCQYTRDYTYVCAQFCFLYIAMGRCFPRSIATTGSIEFCSAALYCAVGIMHPAEHPAPDAGFHRIQLETATIPLDGGGPPR